MWVAEWILFALYNRSDESSTQERDRGMRINKTTDDNWKRRSGCPSSRGGEPQRRGVEGGRNSEMGIVDKSKDTERQKREICTESGCRRTVARLQSPLRRTHPKPKALSTE